jgi:hypothetical protein
MFIMTGRMLFVLAALWMVGCTDYATKQPPATVKVAGKVVLPSGQPLTVGTIRFEPTVLGEGIEAYAAVKQDGSFTVKSFGDRDGLKPGKYVAYLDPTTVTTVDAASKKSVRIPAAASVPVAYLQAGTTKWKIEVTDSMSDLGTLKMQ